MTTAQTIITDGLSSSAVNVPGTLATQATELLTHLSIELGTMFSVAQQENPLYFGSIATISYTGGAWTRPADALVIARLEATNNTTGSPAPANGTEVVIVPIDDRDIMAGTPAVYEFGQKFYGAGNGGDPTGGDLRCFYGRAPALPSAIGDTLDTPWPNQFNKILTLGVAAYLARKDGRDGDAQAFVSDQTALMGLFRNYVQSATLTTHQRFLVGAPIGIRTTPDKPSE